MALTETRTSFGEPGERAHLVGRAFVRFGFMFALAAVALALGWEQLWIWLCVMLATLLVNLAVMRVRNPALLRKRLGPTEAVSAFDRFVLVGGGLIGMSVFVVAGIDVYALRTTAPPSEWMYVGALLHVLGDIPAVWAMSHNPFLRREIRVEQAHQVITTGPYRFVRHPMYLGLILMLAGWPLMLGSLWAFVPAGAMAAIMVARTAFEDRTLHRELAGYEEYASRTRYRLVPGLW